MRYDYTVVSRDPEMVQYLYERLGMDLSGQNLGGPRWFCLAARDVTGALCGALACEFTTHFEAHFSCAIDDPGIINHRMLTDIFKVLFSRVVRVTAYVEPHDGRTENLVRRMGFVYEGFLRRGYDGDRDALIFGMLRDDCKFLPGVRAARDLNSASAIRLEMAHVENVLPA